MRASGTLQGIDVQNPTQQLRPASNTGGWGLAPGSSLSAPRHPLHDKFHFQLIQAPLRSDNRTEAVRAYREYEKICHPELRVLPSRSIRALLDAA